MHELFLDNHLLAADCPGGLLTQPSGTDEDSLEARAKAWLKEKFAKPGGVFLEAVHRIDRPVCGVVLFARTSKALSRLNASSRAREMKKIYHAWVEGEMPRPDGVLEDWLVHDDHCARRVSRDTPGAKACMLHYRTLERRNGFSLLEIILDTGRYHQIRCQLSAAGHPVAGDGRYRSRYRYAPGCIALQHYAMTFPHPVTREILTVTSGIVLACPGGEPAEQTPNRRFS